MQSTSPTGLVVALTSSRGARHWMWLTDNSRARFFRAYGYIGLALGVTLIIVGLIGSQIDPNNVSGTLGNLSVLGVNAIVLGAFARKLARAAERSPVIEFPRPSRDRWSAKASAASLGPAMLVMVGTLPAAYLLAITVVLLPGKQAFIGEVWLPVSATLGLLAGLWAFVALRSEYILALRTATPPQLAKAHDLRDRAAALETVMYEATNLAEDLQRVIDAEKAMIDDLLTQHANAWNLTQLRQDQVDALLTRLDKAQARSDRNQIVINIVIALISLVTGYALNLITPDDLVRLLGG